MNLPLIFSVYFSFSNNNKKGNYLAIIIICKDISIVCFVGFFFRFFSRLCLSYINSPDNIPNNFFLKHLFAQSHTRMLHVFIAILPFFILFLQIFISLLFLLFSINFIREDFGFPRPTHFPSSNLVSLFSFILSFLTSF